MQPGKFINIGDVNVFPDYIEGGDYYTYNQGIALEGLAHLAVFDVNNTELYIS